MIDVMLPLGFKADRLRQIDRYIDFFGDSRDLQSFRGTASVPAAVATTSGVHRWVAQEPDTSVQIADDLDDSGRPAAARG